ncbi:hypothetical protein [Bailinhaonella thermotolerans]|uniref:Uncharacterized protein n=1 Tax=Bailinhaonella thermotolerans TaxID=1070861 RepID=A0A3A4AT21_9ACTN|nr:hypothetical protein [Bailinhaonella thermotolerans]RJL32493.1 hypothetical protein D5H75_13245 [Bailinhaonella thermotolerans]
MTVRIAAIVEIYGSPPSAPWPVADTGVIDLTARSTPAEIGTVVGLLPYDGEGRDGDGCGGEPEDESAPARIARVLAADHPRLPGGLRIHDAATGLTIMPGCCVDLADWRAWSGAAGGDAPWLGHRPAPWVEVAGTDLRVWQDGGLGEAGEENFFIRVPFSRFAALLHGVRHDLCGFLVAAEEWADATAPAQAQALVRVLDRALNASAPLTVFGERR